MKIIIHEFKDTATFYFELTPETVGDVAQILRISRSMISPNVGWCYFNDSIRGGFTVPISKVAKNELSSGRK